MWFMGALQRNGSAAVGPQTQSGVGGRRGSRGKRLEGEARALPDGGLTVRAAGGKLRSSNESGRSLGVKPLPSKQVSRGRFSATAPNLPRRRGDSLASRPDSLRRRGYVPVKQQQTIEERALPFVVP